MTEYKPVTPQQQPKFAGIKTYMRLPHLKAVRGIDFAVAGIPWDGATSYRTGQRLGPDAIRNDQYFDRPYYHGSMFRRAVEENILLPGSSIQVGMRGPVYSKNAYDESTSLGFKVVTMSAVREMGLQRLIEIIKNRVGQNKVFVSFDIDVVDPAYAPGTGTPEVGGFTSAEAVDLIRGLKGLDFVGFDVVEVLPDYDVAEITALLAANIVYEFLSLIALNKS